MTRHHNNKFGNIRKFLIPFRKFFVNPRISFPLREGFIMVIVLGNVVYEALTANTLINLRELMSLTELIFPEYFYFTKK